jgi:phage repressor protein C with HTH and peptisase S24 domain
MPSSSKLPASSKPSLQKSWARKYKEQLVEQKQEWLKTNEKEEEDAVVAATITAIEEAHAENGDQEDLPDNIAEVSNIYFLPSLMIH